MPSSWRQLSRRVKDFGPDTGVAWAHAEALALGSLLEDGIPVRISGQDSERGTFSHRHLVLNDAETGARHTPLQHVSDTRFEIYNSPLTEAAVIGFEYGVAVAADRDLVLWEAQFGDFVNVAQVMIDQFPLGRLVEVGAAVAAHPASAARLRGTGSGALQRAA